MPPLYDLGLYCRPPGAKPEAAWYVLGVGRWLGSPGAKPEASPRVPKSRGYARILGPIARPPSPVFGLRRYPTAGSEATAA